MERRCQADPATDGDSPEKFWRARPLSIEPPTCAARGTRRGGLKRLHKRKSIDRFRVPAPPSKAPNVRWVDPAEQHRLGTSCVVGRRHRHRQRPLHDMSESTDLNSSEAPPHALKAPLLPNQKPTIASDSCIQSIPQPLIPQSRLARSGVATAIIDQASGKRER